MFLGPQMYLILALLAALPATIGVMTVKRYMAVSHAYEAGKRVGAETVAAATTAKATEVAAAVTEGEALAPFVSVDKMVLQDLCNRQASCRDRKKVKP